MSDPGHSPPASGAFVFRTIQLLMLVDIAIGGALVLLGLFVFDFPGLAIAGAFLACMGAGLAVLFRLLSRRAPAPGPTTRRGSPHQLRR
jgi:hypothetical protein